MKSTNVTASADRPNGQNGQPETKGAGFVIKPGQVQNVGDLIAEAKAKNPDSIKEPTTYPATPPDTEPATPEATTTAPETPEPVTAPAIEPAAPVAPAPAQTMALIKTRSRSEEIDFQVEKSGKLQLLNTQLQSLKNKLAELKLFSYAVNKDDDSRYGRITIYDDNNREFSAKNHGLSALVVEQLKTLFEQKIDEKETELLTISKA